MTEAVGEITKAEIANIRNRVKVSKVFDGHVELTKIKDELVGLCPFHKENTPSFKVNDGKQFFKCFGCGAYGDVIDAAMKLGKLDFLTAVQKLRDDAGITRVLTPDEEAALERQKQEREAAEAADLALKVGWAHDIWARAVPIVGTPAEIYLLSRGIKPRLLWAQDWPRTLRWAANAMEPDKLPLAGLVVAVGNRAGQFRGLQRIFLKANGAPCRMTGGDKLKLSLGDIRGNSAKFWTAPDSLGRWGVAEGCETAMAGEQLFQIPVESGISSGNMPNVNPPAWAKHVTIFGDHDNGGFIAAAECKKRYSAIPSIETVRVLMADKPGADMADLLTAGGRHDAA